MEATPDDAGRPLIDMIDGINTVFAPNSFLFGSFISFFFFDTLHYWAGAILVELFSVVQLANGTVPYLPIETACFDWAAYLNI